MAAKILLTGVPGVGKTTVIRGVARLLGDRAAGFYTEERREGKRRVGFDLITLDGKRARLSHVHINSAHRVGRYGVDVEAINSLGASTIEKAVGQSRIIIIDEIGKMELFSASFRDAVTKAFESDNPVVAVIMKKSHPFADSIKRRSDVQLIEVTQSNRDVLPARIARDLGAVS
ncbi:MAG: NTPase [Candidatus Abyssubacteria bacterium]